MLNHTVQVYQFDVVCKERQREAYDRLPQAKRMVEIIEEEYGKAAIRLFEAQQDDLGQAAIDRRMLICKQYMQALETATAELESLRCTAFDF